MSGREWGKRSPSNHLAYSYRNKNVYLLWIFYAFIGGALVMLVPSGTISDNLVLNKFVNSMSRLIPSIYKLISISNFPVITGVYLSVMWSLFPIVGLYTLFNFRLEPKKVSALYFSFISVIGLPMLIFAFYFFIFLPGDLTIEAASTYTSGRGKAVLTLISSFRIMLCIFGGVVFVTLLMFQYVILIGYPWMFFNLFLRDKEHE